MTIQPSIVLITGATSGIGLETARVLLSQSEQSYIILLGGRSMQKAIDARSTLLPDSKEAPPHRLEPVAIDVDSDESIEALATAIEHKHGRVDILINNAGIHIDFAGPKQGMSQREMWQRTWNTNVVGAHLLTAALAPLLIKGHSPRLLYITSGAASLAYSQDPSKPRFSALAPAGFPKTMPFMSAYKASKMGLNMLGREWDRKLRNDGVKTFIVAPGFTVTNLGSNPEGLRAQGAAPVHVAGQMLMNVINGDYDDHEGSAVCSDGIQPW